MSWALDELRDASFRIEDNVNAIKDMEIRKMMLDMCKMMYDIWHDHDKGMDGEEERAAIHKFKTKWFCKRKERLQGFVDERLAEVKQELMEMIGD